MVIAENALHVDGLVDFQRALRQVDAALPKELRVIHKDVAQKIVDEGKRRARGLGRMEAKAAEVGLKAGGEQRGAYVRLRAGVRTPYVFGAEFGAKRDQQRRRVTGTYVGYQQFRPWAGNSRTGGGAGYWMYPAIRSQGSQIIEEYNRALTGLLRRLDL